MFFFAKTLISMPRVKSGTSRRKQYGLLGGRPPSPLTEEQKFELEHNGYTIVDYVREGRISITPEERANIVDTMLDNGSFIVNNLSDGTAGDHTRLMMGVEPADIPGKLAMKVARKLIHTFSYLKLGKATYLSSLEHGHDQLPHIDVSDPNDTLRGYVQKGMVPLSVMVTFREPAVLNIWRGSHTLVWSQASTSSSSKVYGERVIIPPCSAMVFRQDLVHSGTAYSSPNLRVHMYLNLNVDDYEDDSGAIKLVDTSFFKMRVPN